MRKSWFLAIRPWTLTAAVIPILLGTVLAWQESALIQPVRLLAALLGGILLQIAANLFNTWGDYQTGVDTVASAHSCPELVTGTMTPRQIKTAALICLAAGGILGLWLTYECGWVILLIGMIGISGAYCYTAGPCPFKYQGLGTIFVFFLMGPLMVLPAYYIQTEELSWLPLLASLPISCLVTAILHANDLRDLADDRDAGIHTLALALGLNKGMIFYFSLYGLCFLSLFGLIITGLLPVTATLTFLLLTIAYRQLNQARQAWLGNRELMIFLVRRTAAFHCFFGFTLILTIAADHI
jgi:1,4-dihydroxy-2-naphthoate octaprenyltransferase